MISFVSHGHTNRRTSCFWAGLSTDVVIEPTNEGAESALTHGCSLTALVCSVWVHNIHEMATLYLALKSIMKMKFSSRCLTDCGILRVHRDYQTC